MRYKLSIIIPVFNVENYLHRTLDSIISQSLGFEDIEVILVDDKSTDNSAKIMEEYDKKYENIKCFYSEKGSGFPGKPRNIGLKNATSDYIMFLDADDFLEINSCEKLYETIIGEDADIVSGSYASKNRKGEFKLNINPWVFTLMPPELDKKVRIEKTKELLSEPDFKLVVTDLDEHKEIIANPNVWGKIFKKSLIEDNDIQFPEDIVAQDSVFVLETILNAKKIVFIKDIIVYYDNQRDEDGDKSISHVKSKQNLYGRIKAYDLMYNISKQHSREEIFCRYLLLQKLLHWYKKYLLETDISRDEVENIFRKYSHLFTKGYQTNLPMPKSIRRVFKEISEDNFDNAVNVFLKSKKNYHQKQKQKHPEPSLSDKIKNLFRRNK